MGVFLSKQQSPKSIREQAKAYRTDVGPLNYIREQIRLIEMNSRARNKGRQKDLQMSNGEGGNVVTLKPAKGALSSEKLVYAGDITADSVSQARPVLSLEYKSAKHTAVVKSAETGDILMFLVKEYNDEPWYDDNHKPWKCTFGGATESRLYANGRPVGVSFGTNTLNAAPSSQVDGEARPQVGASMVELVKVRQSPSLLFLQKKPDGTPGKEIGIYSKSRGGAAILRMADSAAVDPIVLTVMAWFVNKDESGGV